MTMAMRMTSGRNRNRNRNAKQPIPARKLLCSVRFLAATAMAWILLLSVGGFVCVDASAPVPDEAADAVVADATKKGNGAKTQSKFKFKFVHKTIIIPHDEKKFRGGEDAASTIDTMLVVADGVGGWANRGVNPGLYSRELTETITGRYAKATTTDTATTKSDSDSGSSFDLKQLVHESNHAAAAKHLGSATCTVVRLKDNDGETETATATLETLNIGDSTYSIHRRRTNDSNNNNNNNKDGDNDLTVVYAAEPGQKGFNFPYQLGGRYGDQVHDEGVSDGPRTHVLQPMDVVVVVSDGVNDNMDAHEYHGCIDKYQWTSSSSSSSKTTTKTTTTTPTPTTPTMFAEHEIVSYAAVADCIARTAYFLGKDRKHYSPFARSAASYGKRYLGGKHDDITVIVAQVVASTSSAGAGASASTSNTIADPHRNESIFVYKDEDGPIPGLDELPTMESLLESMLQLMEGEDSDTDSDPVAVGAEL